ncbi:hypothetical protein WEU38_08860 [Cyanobacterium aponinum AL20118]|uniref:Uncharacterized protein n=1 Tax=Cyanobacterium aponinum AL20115 TaxID=3090662 RepID=A0AAF1C332_9CHRO|nr:hypothetical protein [Cyanobacterium aponinum]MBD2394294.1 hypothetical protein [Cyanobacterium aponinum FACHB-4101]WPF90367.1 hypothetical protein SAY89_08880 [Cyanobacterium aponinum AL20115]
MKKNNNGNYINLSSQDFKDYHYPSPEKFNSPSLHRDLQSFSQQVIYLSALHTNGKISTSVAYFKLDRLWQSLNSVNN